MIVYMMQHGLALDVSVDPEEGLSPEGKESVRMSAKGLKKMKVTFEALIASPKKRSIETAQIVAEELQLAKEKIIVTESAKAMAPALGLLHELEHLAPKKSFFIAGHLPNLIETASFLLLENAKLNIAIVNAGVLRIDTDDLLSHEGRLKWYLTPDQLRYIYE
jgi:phosphohistidine phosphatase